jgi:hypothetical protein
VVAVAQVELYTKEHFLLPAVLAYQYLLEQVLVTHQALTDQTVQPEIHPHLAH